MSSIGVTLGLAIIAIVTWVTSIIKKNMKLQSEAENAYLKLKQKGIEDAASKMSDNDLSRSIHDSLASSSSRDH